ncbi:MAG: DUF4258 domain-containing protein [Curvibacter sp.]|jgi:hypothetical protein|nr:DUF4258 domain-containing protein [Curvibacter sp.]
MSPPALSAPQWERFIRKAALRSELIVFTKHALARMKLRGVTRLMVLDVLRQGKLRRTPEPNAARGTLECRMEYFLSGRDIAVVAAVAPDDPGVVVVTVMELS